MYYKQSTLERLEGCKKIINKKELMSYQNRVIVSGSKSMGYNLSYDFFKSYLLELFGIDITNENKKQIGFITGLEISGAESFIIKFCKEYDLAICPFELDWENKKGKIDKASYFKRNEEMLIYSNRLVSFFDGESKGVQHLLDLAESSKLKRNIIRITKEENLSG